MSADSALKTTPLYDIHKKLNAKMVPFAGWHMPIQYSGVMEEHRAVRNGLGLFDVSHMGEIDVSGPDALAFLQSILTNDVSRLDDNAIQYSLMCYENGGVVDDLLVHRFSGDHYFLCVNASNTDKDFEWVQQHAKDYDVQVENLSEVTAQLAVQGKKAEALLQTLTEAPLADLDYYHFIKDQVGGVPCLIARTGYTGEDGFELYLESGRAAGLCETLLEAGSPFGLVPIGLGARDTLRMEMGYALYGNEINAEGNPLEAGLGWVIKLKKDPPFIGQQALIKQKEQGLARKLVGLQLQDRGVPRSHYPVRLKGETVGEVTSGTFSPSLNTGIALCYVPSEVAAVGTRLEVGIRTQNVTAEVVALPMVPSGVKSKSK